MDLNELKTHQYFLKKAIALAQKTMQAGKGGPFGALVVKDGRIVARGYNQVSTKADPTLHAEVDAIRKACKKLGSFELTGCVLYSSCEPCPMCLGATYWAHLDALYFAADKFMAAKHGFDDKFIYDEIALPLEKRTIKTARIPLDEAEAPFNAWDQKTDKTLY